VSSLRFRLAASYAALILLSVFLMGALALTLLQRSVDRREREFLRANAEAVEREARRFLTPQVRRVALGELARTSAFLGNSQVRILSQDGTVLADSGDPGLPDEFVWLVPSGLAEVDAERQRPTPFILSVPPRAPGAGAAGGRESLPFLHDLPLGTSRLYARRILTPWGRVFTFSGEPEPPRTAPPPRRPDRLMTIRLPVVGESGPLGFVEMSSPRSLQSEAVQTMRSSLILSGLGSLAIAIAFGLVIGRSITDPVRRLSAAARAMAGGDLTARARDRRHDELGALARQFNAMAESLEGSFRQLRSERDSLKRFIADASHELRTPITALMTFTELLQGSAAADPAARAEFLQMSERELKRLQWITGNLLDLSRLDAGIAALELGEHDGVDIAREAVSALQPRARERQVRLEAAPAGAAVVLRCDRQRIFSALSNLIANAVKFNRPGGSVGVEVRADGAAAVFSVRDDGPGIDPGDLPRIFDRFYRGRNGTEEGAGLGLAIVKSVAEAHGGSVRAQIPRGGGSLFELTIPMGGRA
jgi:two-component system, OmpR family, sensor histidine kinase BaeS